MGISISGAQNWERNVNNRKLNQENLCFGRIFGNRKGFNNLDSTGVSPQSFFIIKMSKKWYLSAEENTFRLVDFPVGCPKAFKNQFQKFQVLLRCLQKTMISSMYGTHIFLARPTLSFPTRLWNVGRLPVRPIGMSSQLSYPNGILKAVYS